MKKLLLIVLTLAFMSSTAAAQDNNVYGQYFSLIIQLLEKAKGLKADIYSPQNFSEALKYYSEAEVEFKKGGNLSQIRENTEKAEFHLKKSLEFAELARLTFGESIEARNQAFAAGANNYALETWRKAEEVFKGAMKEMEDNDLGSAKEDASGAGKLYRQAELEAIKLNLIGPAKELVKKAEELEAEDHVPVTLKAARESISQVEKLIDQNRYAQEEGLVLAMKAKYHAQHALFLTREIRTLKNRENGFEELMLSHEAHLSNVGEALDKDIDLSRGYGVPVDTLIASIKSIRIENTKLRQELGLRSEQVKMMQEQISSMEKSIGKYSESEKELKRKIELKKAQENTVKAIAQSFSEKEGEVFVSGNNVTIRLYGLSFAPGRSEIRTEYFGLLRKVQDGIKQFGNCQVVVEGHTDSRGSETRNQKLSEQRARSVRQYLLANMPFPADKMKASGYGESKPVANNETAAGREQNRRIDIIILPEWAK